MKLKELVNFIKNDKIISILMIFVVVLIGTLLYYNLNVKIDANQTQLMAETFTSTTNEMCDNYISFLDEYTPELYYKTQSTDPIRYLNKSTITARFNKKMKASLNYNIDWINGIIKKGGFGQLEEDLTKDLYPQGKGAETDTGDLDVIRKIMSTQIKQIFIDRSVNNATEKMLYDILDKTLYEPGAPPRNQPTTYDHLLQEIYRLNIKQSERRKAVTRSNESIANSPLLMTNVYLLVFLIKLDFQRRTRENNIRNNKSIPHIINNTHYYIYLNRIYNTMYEGSKKGLVASGFGNQALDALQSNICYGDGPQEKCLRENKDAVTMPLIYYNPPREELDAREAPIQEMINTSSDEIKGLKGYMQKLKGDKRKTKSNIENLKENIQSLGKELRTAQAAKFKKELGKIQNLEKQIRKKTNKIQTIKAKIRRGERRDRIERRVERMSGDIVIEPFNNQKVKKLYKQVEKLKKRRRRNQAEIKNLGKKIYKNTYKKELQEIKVLERQIGAERSNIERMGQKIRKRTQRIFADDIENIDTQRHTKERKEKKIKRLDEDIKMIQKRLRVDRNKRKKMKKRFERGKRKSGVRHESLTDPLEFDKALISEIKNIIVKYKEYLYTAIPNLEANSNNPTSWEEYASGDGIVWCLYTDEDKDIVSYDKNIKSYCKTEEEYAEPVICPDGFSAHTEFNKTPDQVRNVVYDGDRLGNLTTDPQVGKFAKYCKAGFGGPGKGENYHRDVCNNYGGVFIEGLDHGRGPYRCAIGGEYPISTNGMCGLQGNYQKCPKGQWCAQWGGCGKTAAHVYGKTNKAFNGDELGPKPPKPYRNPTPSNCEPRDFWQEGLMKLGLSYKCK